MPTVIDVVTDKNLLGPYFSGPSWNTWRTVLKAIFSHPMTEPERAQFRVLAERDPPPARVREAWLAIGRRGGKDSIASAIATHSAVYGDFKRFLRPGERPIILIIAATKEQASGLISYISGYFDTVPLLAPLLQRQTENSIELTTGVDIIVLANSFRSIRGRTVAVAIFNELAFWRDDRFANPDRETYSATLPSLVTLRRAGAILIGISSVHRKMGLMYDKYLQHYGKDDPNVLVIRAPSITFNPTIPQADIDLDMQLDPEKARAEWLSEWRTDISTFVDRAIVESLIDRGVRERAPDPNIRNYIGFSDESGGSGTDASTLAIVHKTQDDRIIEDVIRVWKPPFVASAVIQQKADILKQHRLTSVTMDHWAGGLPPSLYAAHGIRTETAQPKSKIYLDLIPILNSRRLLMLDEPTQIAELCNLERRVAWGGHETVDHPQSTNSHDDAINALAGAAVLAATTTPPVAFSDDLLAALRSRARGDLSHMFGGQTIYDNRPGRRNY